MSAAACPPPDHCTYHSQLLSPTHSLHQQPAAGALLTAKLINLRAVVLCLLLMLLLLLQAVGGRRAVQLQLQLTMVMTATIHDIQDCLWSLERPSVYILQQSGAGARGSCRGRCCRCSGPGASWGRQCAQ